MRPAILIDGNSVGYAMHHAALLRAGSLQTQAVYGMIRRLRRLHELYSGANIATLWDGHAQFRYDILPDYKGNRDDDAKKREVRERYREQRPYIKRALKVLGVRQLTGPDCEADDLAGLMVRGICEREPDPHIVLYTGDSDWYQLLRPGVIWRNPIEEANMVSLANLFEKTGYKTPIAYLQGKALCGDSSDNIPGVGGVSKDKAPEWLARWGSIPNFFKKVDSGEYTPAKRKAANAKTPHPEERLASPEGRAIWWRNLELMQLIKPRPQKNVEVIRGEPNKQAFIELCEELNFSTILRDVDRFFAPFEHSFARNNQ